MARLERVEDILRSAAVFEPETEATYNFAAAAMARRRFRTRLVLLSAVVCAITVALLWLAIPKIAAHAPQWPPIMRDGLVTGERSDDALASGDTTKGLLIQNDDGQYARFPRVRPQFSPANLVSDADDRPLLKAKWETENVDRYSTSLLKPAYVEERNPDGSRTRKPALELIPVERGERPSTDGGNDMGIINVSDAKGESAK